MVEAVKWLRKQWRVWRLVEEGAMMPIASHDPGLRAVDEAI